MYAGSNPAPSTIRPGAADRFSRRKGKTLPTPILFCLAALLEIGGCFAFWKWARLGASPLWLIPGMIALAGFAWTLTFADTPAAARAYAAYGGIYVASSLGWMWLVEGLPPDRWDLIGGGCCLVGCLVILFGPR